MQTLVEGISQQLDKTGKEVEKIMRSPPPRPPTCERCGVRTVIAFTVKAISQGSQKEGVTLGTKNSAGQMALGPCAIATKGMVPSEHVPQPR